VDLRRFAYALLILLGGVVLLFLYSRPRKETAPAGPAAERRGATAASEPATRPAIQPTGTAAQQPHTAPAAPASRPASRPASAPSDSEHLWRDDSLAEPEKIVLGSVDPEGKYLFAVELNTRGAAVNTLKLAGYFATVQDKRRYEGNPAEYERALKEDPELKGHYSLLNPVRNGRELVLPYATRSVSVKLPGWETPKTWLVGEKNWRLVGGEAPPASGPRRSAALAWALYDRGRPLLRITKTYTLREADYSFGMTVRVENLSGEPIEVALDQLGPTGVPLEDLRRDQRRAAYGKLDPDHQRVQVRLVSPKKPGRVAAGLEEPIGSSDQTEATLWVGQTNKYFGSMMYLLPARPDSLAAAEARAMFYLRHLAEAPGSMTHATGLRSPLQRLSPAGGQVEMSFDIFAGPKKREMFSDQNAKYYKPLYKQLNYLATIDFGRCCSWGPLSLGMMWLLQKLSVVMFGNYGLAIILLVLLVRIVLHPLTKKGQVTMMKMQKLAPAMQKLKEKYADDKEALNRETMKLYKQQGAMPLLGCLPMLLQMPIWVALFTSLNAAVELRHAAFLPVWITDLAAPDRLVTWSESVSLPLIGNSLNLLPILLTVAMFFQTKLNPQMGAQATAGPDQQKQQKMMRYMMPAMMLLFFYQAPSGLTLYIMASTFAGVIEQMVIRRHIQKKEAEEAAMQTLVRVPGKGPRGSRPKKPKGPFWVKKG